MLMSSSPRTKIVKSGKDQPVVCPVCEFVLRDISDVKSVKKEKACSECTLNFKNLNIDKWESGWRPNLKEARSKILHI